MNWNSVLLLLLLAFLLVFHVICPPTYMFSHAPPAPPGSVLNGAFGGEPKDDVAVWRITTPNATSKEVTTQKPTKEEPTTKELTTEEPTTAEPSTEEPTTKEITTEEPTTEVPTTEEPTTEEPTTEEPTTEEFTTEEATTVVPTTEEATTEEHTTAEPTTEEPSTANPTTEEPTTAEPTTEQPTTEEPSTEEPTTEEATTEEPTTEEKTTEALTTEEVTTEEATTEADNKVSATTDDLMWILNSANGRIFQEKLPDGTPIKDLGTEYKVYNGTTDWSRIVANENGLYVLHPVQSKVETAIFDPFTIGQVLGYVYEKQEFGDKKPPGGKYTIELMGKQIPTKRSAYPGKSRRATLIFTKKNDHF
ncbi:hypothetical protein CAEBREN_15370 [Caenorhabditis brenneri]|uniref:Uncharacterized protein n=1 Tax=Caenorhabditis brenneri TaxID=135651 RepID=G0P4D8_CAEBE|nr:hypothetical protein CAEBREN_15370 [Caenorhabditis brenneri]